MKEFIDSLPGVARGCWLCEGNNKRNSDRVKIMTDLIERQIRSGELLETDQSSRGRERKRGPS